MGNLIFAFMEELKYIIREPKNITEQTPLLVLIHGYGSNEDDLFSFVPSLPEHWLIVSLRAPLNTQFSGYAWYDIDFVNAEKFINVEQAQQSLQMILKAIEDLRKKYELTGETHLCGFSQGGILSYALALKFPHLFSKIACLSAYPEIKILDDIKKDKKAMEHLRFFVSHGTDDAVIPLDWGRKGADLLYDMSIYFSFREYISGHGVNQKNYMDLMSFFKS